MKTITLDLTTSEGRAAAFDAIHGKRRASKPRRAKGEGTMSRTSALNTLARAGWTRYACDDVTHTMRHADGRTAMAATYDALLDALLKEVRKNDHLR